MLTQKDIIDFCDKFNYDIRLSGNGRWIDQKCTADVVTVIADCIYNYELENTSSYFTSRDIWHSEYAVYNVKEIFKKPSVENKGAENEYDKFFQQPMEMFSNAGVLIKQKKGRENLYRVNNLAVLEYIALRERNALFFIKTYINKVLKDSGLSNSFDEFFSNQTQDSYLKLKDTFTTFTTRYTKINGKTECGRIFTKVLNPLAYFNNSLGTKRGRISPNQITYDMLMYNQDNFRDIYSKKPKGVTRKEYVETHPVKCNVMYYHYQAAKAKRFLRLFNDKYRGGKTEYFQDGHINDVATHMHHIFPEAIYPEISYYLENLIALTPTQHLNYAHPNGKTQEINECYQHILLLSKSASIEENLLNDEVETIYDFSNFKFVLKVGLDNDIFDDIIDLDFVSVVNAINVSYAK